MSPEKVASLYRRVRAEALGEGRRHRAITEKHAQLAVFAAEARDTNRTWNEVRIAWSEKYPDWTFSSTRIFIDAARSAYQRVTGQRLEWGGKE